MKQYVHKACPVILRQQGDNWQILAFKHPKGSTQLVKGTVEDDEQPAATVLRELAEESSGESLNHGFTHYASRATNSAQSHCCFKNLQIVC